MDKLPAVKKRFDNLANEYNKKLEIAKFFGHDHMLRALKVHGNENWKNKSLEILDIGCGTGLCGQAFRPYASFIDGVDLSEKMLEKARELGIYRQLYANDIVSHLSSIENQYNLITSASVFLYFEELETVLSRGFSALKNHGSFIFTCDRHEDNNIDVQKNTRNNLMFTHSENYVRNCVSAAGFKLILLEKIEERLNWNNQDPVPALIALAEAI